MSRNRNGVLGLIVLAMMVVFSGQARAAHPMGDVILNKFTTISTIASTIPANHDLNPYGVARVMQSVGNLKAGHILVSNFNNSANLQGTGSTIVDVTMRPNYS